MNASELRQTVLAHFPGAAEHSQPGAALLEFERDGQPWAVALCPAQADAFAYLAAFEAAMQAAIAARQAGQAQLQLALAVDFTSARAGQGASYRRALKKYSNSVVFEDLGLSLLLVEPGSLLALAPAEVNPFLADLNRWLASAARKA